MKRFHIAAPVFLLSLLAVLGLAACSPGAAAGPTSLPATAEISPTALPAAAEATATPAAVSLATSEPTQPAATPTGTPALQAGQWTFLFYHNGLGTTVLVNGGPESGKPAGEPLELWAWDGTGWALLSADRAGPTWRNWPAAAYDPDRDVLVLHGGEQGRGVRFAETWEWDGESWVLLADAESAALPGDRTGALMVYNPARQRMVLFGGAAADEIKNDTWEWDGQSWTLASETGPPSRFPGAMVYDAARQQVLLYSGHLPDPSGAFVNYADLWAWDGENWAELPMGEANPGHRNHTALVYDPESETVLLFGGAGETFYSDLWAWNGVEWSELSNQGMPARSGHNVAYDPVDEIFLLFGGVDRPAARASGDTWRWDRQTWSCISNCE